MADISRSMYRNSSILSKKLSSSHTFRGKSVYDDVFASSSSSPSSKKLKATFSARMEDYCEIFNCSSSIPFLDLPDVDAVVDIPSSNSDYAAIFGDSLEEAWIESGTTLDEDEDEDTSGLEKNGVPSEDDEMYETVDGKKQFKMSYHQTSIGRRDGISGTTHIAQLHAVSGFTCLIDEVPPLQKTKSIKLEPVSLIGDLSSVTNIQEGLKEEKYHEKVSSDLPKSGFKAGGRSESFSNGVQFNAHKESISKHETYERDHSSSRPDIQKGSMEDKCREQVSSNLSNSGFKEGGRSESFSNGVQFNAHKESISKHETYERDHSSSLPDIQKWSMEDKCREQVSSNLSNSGFKGGRSRSESFSNGMQFNAHKESISEHKTHERDDSSSRPDIQEGSMEDKYLKKFSSNLPNSTSKEFGSAGSFANGMQFNAFSFGSNTHYPAESNSNYGTHEADEFLNAMDDTPTFSDEEVDLNSTAAASATAVRKAIELAQESIRLAKEVMDKHKGMWNSATHSSRSDVKVKELREIKIAGEGKRPKEEKSQRLQEPKKDRIDNFSGINRESARSTTYFPVQGVIMETDGKHSKLEPLLSEYKQAGHRAEDAAQLSSGIVKNETDFKTSLIIEKEDIKKDTTPTDDESDEIWQSAMDTFESSDSDSESLKVDEEDFVPTQFGLNTNAGEQELENSASKIELGEELPDIEGTGKKLEVTEKHFESEEKLNETEKQEECEEDIIDSQEPIEHTNESTTMPWEDYDDKEEVEELQKQLEKGINLEEAHNEDKEKYEVLEDSDNEVHEIKLEGVTVIVEKIHVSRLEEVCGCLEDEKKASHELEVQEASVTVRAEKNEAEDQELEFDDYHNGKGIANRLNEKLEIEGYAIHNEAWKQEESDNTVQEAGWEEERAHEHRHAYLMEEEEADEAEECGLKHRRSYQKQEQESNINTGQESLTHPEKVGEVENLRGAGESYRDENYNANVEAVQNVFTQEEILRMDRDTNPSSEPEESEEVTDADVVEIEPEDKETCAGCVDGDVAGHDDHQIENNGQDVSTSFSTEGEEINKSEEELKTAGLAKEIEQKEMLTTTCSSEDEYEHEVEDIVIELEEEVMRETASFSEEEVLVETASTSEEEQEHNDAKNSLKDEDGAFFIEELVLNLGEASIKSGHEHIIDQNTDEGLACDMGVPVVGPTDKVEESKKKEEAEVPACDQVKELDEIKAANADKDEVNIENKMGADGLNSLLKGKENTTEAAQDTRSDRFTEVLGKLNRAWIAEEKERERERERERVAVERAIHEARERAFTDVRERAEKAAMEKAIEEARQRIKTSVRKTLDKAAEANNSIASNVSSMEAKRKSERAAVERATGEARERALVKAMSEKVAFEAKGHYQGAGPSSSCQYSSNGVSERFDDGAKPESVERNKAKLEKQQRIVERAAKALEEKNKRDLLAQREQAERNRYAEVLDADVKRWLKGKKGNLRALLSTLQYILGPDSGWQPVHLNDIVANSDVKKAYRKATLLVHPDKLQQRGASIQQKYICEKVFDLLKVSLLLAAIISGQELNDTGSEFVQAYAFLASGRI